eukprot:GHVQ01033595.1.p3 GENE.GHVQ01033595.1~~GHVQ01033595.1.p3  ORF type:complete len:118 (-),score=10.93 GHVQ01033595.1:1059-1412(-)
MALSKFITAACLLFFNVKVLAQEVDTGSSRSPIVEGVVRLNGKEYKAVCNCAAQGTDVELLKTSTPTCNPSKVKIQQDHEATDGMTTTDVRNLYGEAADISFGKTADYHLSCLVCVG